VGIDEAGYGPTLGPLTAAAVFFEPEEGDAEDVPRLVAAACPRIADSKKVYTPRRGIGVLEGVLAPFFRSWFGSRVESFSALLEALTGRDLPGTFEGVPWCTGEDMSLPAAGDAPEAGEPAAGIPGVLRSGAAARVVSVPRFNRLIREGMNKATLLFAEVCGLIRGVFDARPEFREAVVAVDRLGGRRFYRRLLAEQFPSWRIRVHRETPEASVYLLEKEERRMTLSFRVGADGTDACVGLASLVAKYLRELSMMMFNRYFRARVPGLRPTQGYPADARRFLAEVSSRIFPGDRETLVRMR